MYGATASRNLNSGYPISIVHDDREGEMLGRQILCLERATQSLFTTAHCSKARFYDYMWAANGYNGSCLILPICSTRLNLALSLSSINVLRLQRNILGKK